MYRRRSSKFLRGLILALLWFTRPFAAGLFLLFRLLPENLAYLFVRPIGAFIRFGKRPIVLSRAQFLLGKDSLPAVAARDFWRAHLVHTGLTVIEPYYFFHLPDDQLVGRVDLAGQEHLSRALARGGGAILFLNHLGNPGAIVAGLGLRGYDLTIAGNAMVASIAGEEVPLVHIENVVQRMFARGRVQRALLGEGLPRRMAETLARNGLFAMFIDFPVVRKHNQIVPFGHACMNINLGPAILALRYRAPVLPVTCIRTAGRRHQLTIHPPLETPADPAALLQAALASLLPDLQRHPDQWWPWDWAQLSPLEKR